MIILSERYKIVRLNKLIRAGTVLASSSAQLQDQPAKLRGCHSSRPEPQVTGSRMQPCAEPRRRARPAEPAVTMETLSTKSITARTPTATDTSRRQINPQKAKAEGRRTLICFARNTAQICLPRVAGTHIFPPRPPHLEWLLGIRSVSVN